MRRSLTALSPTPRISRTVLASTTQPARRCSAPCWASTTPALDGVQSARRSGARSNDSAWSHEPEVEGPRHAPKRNDFRDTHTGDRGLVTESSPSWRSNVDSGTSFLFLEFG